MKFILASVIGLVAAAAAVVGYRAHARSAEEEFAVICCGQCQPGDNCLERCEVRGTPPEGLVLTCCGNCQAGDNCAEKCGGARCSSCSTE